MVQAEPKIQKEVRHDCKGMPLYRELMADFMMDKVSSTNKDRGESPYAFLGAVFHPSYGRGD